MYRFLKKYHYLLITFMTLAAMFAVMSVDKYLQNTTSPHGILDFEFAKTSQRAFYILQDWGITGQKYAAFSLGIDYLFLVFYTLFFMISVYKVAENNHFLVGKLALPFSLLFLTAGIYDALENYFLLSIIVEKASSQTPLYAYISAASKFVSIAIGLAFLTAALLWKVLKKLSRT